MKISRIAQLGAVAAIAALALSGCASNEAGGTTDPSASDAPALTGTLNGSGATSQQVAVQAWTAEFQGANPDVTVNYDPQGSGTGRESFQSGAVQFAGSDRAFKAEEIEAGPFDACVEGSDLVEIPAYVSPIAIAFNLEGVDSLDLDPATIAGIFAGTITNWNDPKIAEANPDVDLPDMPITVVVRSDSSGTTFNFTGHLAAIDADFAAGPGAGTSVQWPASDKIIKAPKNDGITATVMQTPGAIGYIEYGYGKLTGTPMAILQNAAGAYVAPGGEGGAEALASAQFDDRMRAFITDPAGAEAYPIATFTWMVFYEHGQDAAKVAAIKEMVEYGLTDGQEMAEELGYIPMPASVIDKVRAAAQDIGAGA